MPDEKHPLITGARVNSLGTLAGRATGLLRDMATASLLGLSGGMVADAFSVAYRIPNLFRRLFGEGALAASYLPVLSKTLESDPREAWRLASTLFVRLALFLLAVAVIGEGAFFCIAHFWSDSPGLHLLMGLAAAMLPYLVFICVAAQLSATLQCLGEFLIPSLMPAVVNLVWLLAAWIAAPRIAATREGQAYVLAVSVLIAGALQILLQIRPLRNRGFRFELDFASSRAAIREIVRNMAPMLLGLAVTQINTFSDSMIAWLFSSPTPDPTAIAWFPGLNYPMNAGAAASLYYGERMYELPMGLVGAAIATAIFPLLSRHAARSDFKNMSADMTLGLRMTLALSIPASVGLAMLAQPLSSLLFERGNFTPDDAVRAARMIACYAVGVWAYCAAPIVVRGFYALGDGKTPVRIAARMTLLDITLNLTLIWPLAERGLALSTAAVAALQFFILLRVFSRRAAAIHWRPLAKTTLRAVVASALMAGACFALMHSLPDWPGFLGKFIRLAAPASVGLLLYTAAFRFLGGREISMLFSGRNS